MQGVLVCDRHCPVLDKNFVLDCLSYSAENRQSVRQINLVGSGLRRRRKEPSKRKCSFRGEAGPSEMMARKVLLKGGDFNKALFWKGPGWLPPGPTWLSPPQHPHLTAPQVQSPREGSGQH